MAAATVAARNRRGGVTESVRAIICRLGAGQTSTTTTIIIVASTNTPPRVGFSSRDGTKRTNTKNKDIATPGNASALGDGIITRYERSSLSAGLDATRLQF